MRSVLSVCYRSLLNHETFAIELSSVCSVLLPSVLWRCWLGGRKGIWPVETEWWGAGMVICLERDADLHMAQLMPLSLTVSCFKKIQTGFTFLVPAHPGSPGKRAVKWLHVACSVLFFSRPRSEGWPHHECTLIIYPCPLSFWLTLPESPMSTSWCCPFRLCVATLACVHLTLFLALSLSPGNSLVSSWCDHSMLASLLWRCQTVPSLLQLC